MRGCATSNYSFCYIHIHGSEDYIILLLLFLVKQKIILYMLSHPSIDQGIYSH